jgi:hypothetical protein
MIAFVTLTTTVGSITILWSQPVTGLQILSPDGAWRYIKHIPNALASRKTSRELLHFDTLLCY